MMIILPLLIEVVVVTEVLWKYFKFGKSDK